MANRNDEERNRGGWIGRDREDEPSRGPWGGGSSQEQGQGSQGSGYGYQGGYGSYSSTAGVGGGQGTSGQGGWNRGQGNYGNQGSQGSGYGYQGGYGSYSSTAGTGGQSQSGRESWEGPHAGRGPQGYQRSNDSIREEVCERLTRHGHIDASGVQVSIENGEVTLEGTVKTRREKRLAEDVLESVSGVRDVHNRLRLESGEPNGRDQQQSAQGTTGTQAATGSK